jgi:hypothetical protein
VTNAAHLSPTFVFVAILYKNNALLPVVAEEDAVRVEHGQDLEDDVFAQRQRHRMAAHQEVYQACGHTKSA